MLFSFKRINSEARYNFGIYLKVKIIFLVSFSISKTLFLPFLILLKQFLLISLSDPLKNLLALMTVAIRENVLKGYVTVLRTMLIKTAVKKFSLLKIKKIFIFSIYHKTESLTSTLKFHHFLIKLSTTIFTFPPKPKLKFMLLNLSFQIKHKFFYLHQTTLQPLKILLCSLMKNILM